MQEYIGEKLEIVVEKLNLLGLKYEIIDNNFNVKGDQKLVTNIIAKDNTVVIITGDFIFDVRNKSNE
ncbi:MAG: hypothetical protein E7376_00545 [Clostridiales bacterium]|nr:hypothetical protein [Clostridiales bacterium]